jgi:hypothetical protein
MPGPSQLDYESALPRPSRVAELFLRFVHVVRWFFFYRPLNAAEVAIGAWLAWSALWVFWTARRFEIASNTLKPAIALTVVLAGVVAVALLRLAVRRRWKALATCAGVALAVAPLSGLVQFERCPHASYVQVFGFSFTVDGERCGNDRRIEPWWMRE